MTDPLIDSWREAYIGNRERIDDRHILEDLAAIERNYEEAKTLEGQHTWTIIYEMVETLAIERGLSYE